MKNLIRFSFILIPALAVVVLSGCSGQAEDPEKTESNRRSGVEKGPADEGDK